MATTGLLPVRRIPAGGGADPSRLAAELVANGSDWDLSVQGGNISMIMVSFVAAICLSGSTPKVGWGHLSLLPRGPAPPRAPDAFDEYSRLASPALAPGSPA